MLTINRNLFALYLVILVFIVLICNSGSSKLRINSRKQSLNSNDLLKSYYEIGGDQAVNIVKESKSFYDSKNKTILVPVIVNDFQYKDVYTILYNVYNTNTTQELATKTNKKVIANINENLKQLNISQNNVSLILTDEGLAPVFFPEFNDPNKYKRSDEFRILVGDKSKSEKLSGILQNNEHVTFIGNSTSEDYDGIVVLQKIMLESEKIGNKIAKYNNVTLGNLLNFTDYSIKINMYKDHNEIIASTIAVYEAK